MKEIVTGSDQGEVAKPASTRGHQDCAISMACVIAAQQKWPVRKVMSLLNRQRTIPPEECPAKTLETETAWR